MITSVLIKMNQQATIKTVHHSQTQCLRDIMQLYGIRQIGLDPTFSKGVVYGNDATLLPTICGDIAPIPHDKVNVVYMNYVDTKLETASVSSIFFDPPFIIRPASSTTTSLIQRRFSAFNTPADMFASYREAMLEMYRILRVQGWLIFKCQDTVSNHTQYLTHVNICQMASAAGLYVRDLFVLVSNSRMINAKRQEHARKYHSYMIVIQKARMLHSYSWRDLTNLETLSTGLNEGGVS